MAATFSSDHEDVAHRARELRTRSLELAEDELRAYEPVLDALRLPSEDPARTERIRAAQVEASKPPLAIARVAAEVTELGSHVARTGNQNLAGDAIAATLLAEAAGQAAARLVRINLGDNPLVREATELARRARFAREEALN